MEYRNQIFMEIGQKLPKEKCEIVTLQASFSHMSKLYITYPASFVKKTTLVVFEITKKNEICHMHCVA